MADSSRWFGAGVGSAAGPSGWGCGVWAGVGVPVIVV